MAGGVKRARMQVDPERLVDLAASCDDIVAGVGEAWAAELEHLEGACADLGDTEGAIALRATYDESLVAARDLVGSLTGALSVGVRGLVEAAHDAASADATVAVELSRTAARMNDDPDLGPRGRGH